MIIKVVAALAVGPPDGCVSRVTGLVLRRAPVPAPALIQLESTHPHPVRRQGVQVARVRRLPPSVRRVATPAHCFVSACAELDLLQAVTAGDFLLHAKLATLAELGTYANLAHVRGVVAARRALTYVRPGVESPRESWLRLLLVLAGLPTPQCNVTLGDQLGPLARVDLLYAKFMLILEYEGLQHLTDRHQWNRDIERFEALSGQGFTILRITDQRIRRPREVVAAVHTALRAAGYRGPAPRLSPEWSQLFE